MGTTYKSLINKANDKLYEAIRESHDKEPDPYIIRQYLYEALAQLDRIPDDDVDEFLDETTTINDKYIRLQQHNHQLEKRNGKLFRLAIHLLECTEHIVCINCPYQDNGCNHAKLEEAVYNT